LGEAVSNKVIINLATGLEDAERVTVAFLVGVSAAERGQPVRMFVTKEAVRLALKDGVVGIACDGCPPLPDLAQRYSAAGGLLQVCPVCFNARKLDQADLVENAEVAGAVPLFEWLEGEAGTVFSY
jgi:predicted peroxiredoxin